MKKILKILLSIVLLIIISIVILFTYFAGTMCKNKIYQEYLSPDKSYKAVVFQRDCGATTAFSTQISILKSNNKLNNESANVFIVKGHPTDVSPILNWENNNKLNIQYSLDGDEYLAKESLNLFKPIQITYSYLQK